MELLFCLQTWQTAIKPFTILGAHSHQVDFSLWSAAKFQAERYSLALSVYYYKTVMLVCAPLLMRVLEQVTDSTSVAAATGTAAATTSMTATAAIGGGGTMAVSGNDAATSFNSMLLEMSAPVLKRELHAIGEYQGIANGILRHQPSFFKTNAIWWVCNFNCK